jgi:dihydrodipicolinate synthase/N-acetylneuraminate lyase
MAAIEGIFVPNIVPYDAQGRINEEELRRIIRWLVSKGVTGFYPNGSMGEFIRLSYEERKRVLKIVVEEADGKPRGDLWVADGVHPNHAGYQLRVKLMLPLLGGPEKSAKN